MDLDYTPGQNEKWVICECTETTLYSPPDPINSSQSLQSTEISHVSHATREVMEKEFCVS